MLTTKQIARIRRAIDEPDPNGVYTDNVLNEYAEEAIVPGTSPERIDLNWIIAEIWGEKAAAVAKDFAVDSDGSRLERNQKFDQFIRNARHYRAKTIVRTLPAKIPEPITESEGLEYVDP